jgi:hypothetical protein
MSPKLGLVRILKIGREFGVKLCKEGLQNPMCGSVTIKRKYLIFKLLLLVARYLQNYMMPSNASEVRLSIWRSLFVSYLN